MKPQRLKEMLQATLEDQKLSRAEKRALDQIFEHLNPRSQALSLCRNMAFDLAREELKNEYQPAVIDWLEDVNRLIQVQGQNEESRDVVTEACFSPDDDCPRRIASLLNQAKQRVEICVFTVTDDRISEAISDAHKRGVQIRIITDDDKSEDLGSDVRRLRDQGIDVRMDRSAFHMHHKFAIFDGGKLLNGSYNWTRGAAEKNEENFVITGDPRLVHSFSKVFEKLWDKFE